MRSQTTKSPPKKGAQCKTSVAKAQKPGKKRNVPTSKAKKIIKKSPSKSPKKSDLKTNLIEKQNEGNNQESKIEANIASSSTKASTKSTSSRGNSPTKKVKTEIKDKKETSKISLEITKKPANQKVSNDNVKAEKKTKSKAKKRKCDSDKDNDNVKYKINSDSKKPNLKFSKAKNIVKKGLKKTPNNTLNKSVTIQKETLNPENNKDEQRLSISSNSDSSSVNKNDKLNQKNVADTVEKKTNDNNSSSSNSINSNTPPSSEPTERPPKFFTSSRSPRMVDIDVKCCKNSKGNLSVSERFVSMKCTESKSEDMNKDKSSSNTLVSQGPDIDVYTFTEKVDSPKSILPEFRNTTNKNVNRVRPIARVKGTIIDKNKADSERKKYSPHRPIEEVVKQLKASKKCEEVKTTETTLSTSDVSTPSAIKSDEEEKPKPIVSKSYKMVARKSSIPGKPFSPIKFLEQDTPKSKGKAIKASISTKKTPPSPKKKSPKIHISDEEIETSKFSLNTESNVNNQSSSDESDNDDAKESSESETLKPKTKTKKYKRKKESPRKKPAKDQQQFLEEPIEMIEVKEEPISDDEYEQPSKRRLKLISMWNGPKQHRMASLNALAKVHCLYENENRTHMELGLMKTVGRPIAVAGCSNVKPPVAKKKEEKPCNIVIKQEYNSESEYESPPNYIMDSSEEEMSPPNTRTLRGVTGMRSAGKYWDLRTSSSEESETDSTKNIPADKKKTPTKAAANKSDSDKQPVKVKKISTTPRKKRIRNEVVMDLKDMVVQKRMASLNASAILAASYEKRSPKSSKDDSTSDSCSDESFIQKSKNGVSSGVKSEAKNEDSKKEVEDVSGDKQQKVEVIVNQDTDVTITGVYSTHHQGFCTVAGMQYRISSTSHTQTTATSNCEKEECARDEGTARYTPLTALSSMQPPLEQQQSPAPELGNLTRRAAGCSSAFTAPPPAPHHDPVKKKSKRKRLDRK